jgi:hypothetical protein
LLSLTNLLHDLHQLIKFITTTTTIIIIITIKNTTTFCDVNCLKTIMIIVPIDVSCKTKHPSIDISWFLLHYRQVKCNFCKKKFCCKQCREKHEKNSHSVEMDALKHDEYIKSICYLCNGQKLPLQDLKPEIMQHIIEIHLPLKCSKCFRLFEDFNELCEFGKCCPPPPPAVTIPLESIARPLEVVVEEVVAENLSFQAEEKGSVKPITPLSQINLRWRRKSREFGKMDLHPTDHNGEIVRQTSTPMQMTASAAHFTDSSCYSSSSIQISSINFTSSCSSESDEFSPPLSIPKPKIIPNTSPKPVAINRSRPKMPVQATPLRQVMSKSIQKAIAEHGHYRSNLNNVQQRKMSFNSTNSSGENSMSLIKVPSGNDSPGSHSPLDLRLSPALRRIKDEPKDEKQTIEYRPEPGDLINFDSNIENVMENDQIHIENRIDVRYKFIIRRNETKSDSSAMTSYKSVFSDTGRSGSMPEIHITPKMVGNNFMKKTISFETPEIIENTPGFLLPMGTVEDCDDAESDDDNDFDDVFYTPRASPIRVPLTRRASADTVISIDESSASGNDSTKTRKNLWNVFSGIGGTLTIGDWITFKQPAMFKRATDYFSKRSSEPDEYPHKRRRTSSTSSNDFESLSPPATKRQKIQARKPIGRMTRHMSLN